MSASAGGVKAGKAFILIEAVDKTAAVIRSVGGRFQSFGKQITSVGDDMLKSFGSSVQSLGKHLMMFSALASMPLAMSGKVFADFDDSLRKVEARSSGTAEEMKALREQAKALGATTAFTAGQVGELQAKIATKGFSRSEIGQMTGGIVNLALAGGEGNPEEDATIAADLVSGTLKAFKMGADQSNRVADLFTATLNASNFSLQGLLDAMSVAGPVASDFNLSLEETLATLGQLVDLNIDPETAATAFRNMNLELSDPEKVEKFQARLQELGGAFVNFRDASGKNLKKLPELLFEIGDATKHLGTAEKGEVFNLLFGKRALVPGSVLSNAENPFKNMMKILEESNGLAEKTAATMEGGLGGAFRNLTSAVEGVAISVGEALATTFIPLMQRTGELLGVFSKWISENQGLVTAVTASIAAVGALSAVFLAGGTIIAAVGGAIGLVGAAITAIGTIAGIVLTPIGAVVAVIAALGAVVVASFGIAIVESERLRDVIVGTFGEILTTIESIGSGISDALQAGDVELAWEIAMAGLELLWLQTLNGMLDSAVAWAESLRKLIGEALKGYVEFLTSPIETIKEKGAAALGMGDPISAAVTSGLMLDTNEALARQKFNDLQLEALGKKRQKDQAKAASDSLAASMAANRNAPVKGFDLGFEDAASAISLNEDVSLAEADRWQGAAQDILNGLTGSLEATKDIIEEPFTSVLTGLQKGSMEAAATAIENQIRAEADDAAKDDVQAKQLEALERIDTNLENSMVMEVIA